jgi:ribosome-associated heat shock protein Hsp15
MSKEPLEKQRLDKWLWAARFFKTRRLASDAISGGKVHLNGQRTKPAKEVKVEDQLSISKDSYSWNIEVCSLNNQRRPASEACLMYAESAESIEARAKESQKRRDQRLFSPTIDEGRPSKKQRRQIHHFKRKE